MELIDWDTKLALFGYTYGRFDGSVIESTARHQATKLRVRIQVVAGFVGCFPGAVVPRAYGLGLTMTEVDTNIVNVEFTISDHR